MRGETISFQHSEQYFKKNSKRANMVTDTLPGTLPIEKFEWNWNENQIYCIPEQGMERCFGFELRLRVDIKQFLGLIVICLMGKLLV